MEAWNQAQNSWLEGEPNGNSMIFSSWTLVFGLNIFKLLESQGIIGIDGNENDNASLSRCAAISYPVFISKRNNLL
jgi:hypothetical protein